MDYRGKKYEIIGAGVRQRRVKADQAWQGSRCLYDGAMAWAAKGVCAAQSHDKVQALVENSGEWPCRIEGGRAEYWFYFAMKVVT